MEKIFTIILTAFVGGLFGLFFKLIEEPVKNFLKRTFSKSGETPVPSDAVSPFKLLNYQIWGLGGMVIGVVLALLWSTTRPPATSGSGTPVPLPDVAPWKQGTILYEENFENGRADGWLEVNDGKWDLWQVNGNWVYGVRDQPPQYILTTFLDQSKSWQDYGVELQFMFQTGQLEQTWFTLRTGAATCTGYNFGGNRYGLTLARFDPRQNCDSTQLGSVPNYPLVSNRLYKLRMEVLGNEIRCYLDDQLVIRATDSVYPKGGLAMASYQVEWGWFDNIRVYSVSR